MASFRTLELYPHGMPAKMTQMIGATDIVTHYSRVFRECMLREDIFRSEDIRIGKSAPVFAQFQRVGNTAGFATWTRYQPSDLVETVRRGFDAFTLLLSGISDDADAQVVEMFRELVTTPVLMRKDFTTQNYGIQPEFVEKVRVEARPVGLNIYLRPNVVGETGISSAAAGMVIAFFSLLGAEWKSGG